MGGGGVEGFWSGGRGDSERREERSRGLLPGSSPLYACVSSMVLKVDEWSLDVRRGAGGRLLLVRPEQDAVVSEVVLPAESCRAWLRQVQGSQTLNEREPLPRMCLTMN